MSTGEVSAKASESSLSGKVSKPINSDSDRSPSVTSIASKSSSNVVKWLYPSEVSDMESSEVPTDQSIQGSPINCDEGVVVEKSSPTTSGPDSDVGSVDELPDDDSKESGVADELTKKMSTGANYIGSIFSSAWTKTTKTANEASASSFFSSFSKSAEVKPDSSDGTEHPVAEEASTSTTEEASSFFSSAMSKVGFKTKEPKETKEMTEELTEEEPTTDGTTFSFSSAFSMVSKVTSDATSVIKDKVSHAGILAEFNREQEEFIKTNKNKGHLEGLAPWVGYRDEDELKTKILALSEDKRNFVRAPPSGVAFEYDHASVSSTALALLAEDPRLDKMRYELVPKAVKEEEFWRNYFYRVNLIKQSFELKDLEDGNRSVSNNHTNNIAGSFKDNDVDDGIEHDDEFVSDAYQADPSDMAEANESMKRLGVTDEWEAELEGELQEYEVVEEKENAEWENQIQEMLDAEEGK